MKNELIEITQYDEKGYKPLIYFEQWRVAILNDDAEKFRVDGEGRLEVERHNGTDEVFVLLEGECTLYIGGGQDGPESIECIRMEKNRIYNIKKGTWHGLTGNPAMKLLIVENADTSVENSDFCTVQVK